MQNIDSTLSYYKISLNLYLKYSITGQSAILVRAIKSLEENTAKLYYIMCELEGILIKADDNI